jgi:hypothetical protein
MSKKFRGLVKKEMKVDVSNRSKNGSQPFGLIGPSSAHCLRCHFFSQNKLNESVISTDLKKHSHRPMTVVQCTVDPALPSNSVTKMMYNE